MSWMCLGELAKCEAQPAWYQAPLRSTLQVLFDFFRTLHMND